MFRTSEIIWYSEYLLVTQLRSQFWYNEFQTDASLVFSIFALVRVEWFAFTRMKIKELIYIGFSNKHLTSFYLFLKDYCDVKNLHWYTDGLCKGDQCQCLLEW